MSVMQQHGRDGSDDRPAQITQGDWDRHRGQLIRCAGLVDDLAGSLKQCVTTLDLTRIEMRSLRAAVAEFKKGVSERLDKHSDWRETTGRHDVEQLQKQLEKYEQKDERRMALWVKVVLGVLAAVAEAGIVHFLKW